jgi:hypothetical protein
VSTMVSDSEKPVIFNAVAASELMRTLFMATG